MEARHAGRESRFLAENTLDSSDRRRDRRLAWLDTFRYEQAGGAHIYVPFQRREPDAGAPRPDGRPPLAARPSRSPLSIDRNVQPNGWQDNIVCLRLTERFSRRRRLIGTGRSARASEAAATPRRVRPRTLRSRESAVAES